MTAHDLTGQTFGKLTVLYRSDKKAQDKILWHCRCSCGNETDVQSGHLKDGHSKSCGWCQKIVVKGEGVMQCTVKSGKSFLFDAEDLALVRSHRWYVDRNGYVRSYVHDKQQPLHRLLIHVPDEMLIDHINGDPSDNRKENLRVVTILQNNLNSKKRSDGMLPYKGVRYNKTTGKYQARIGIHGKRYHLGTYQTSKEAAFAYDRAASFYFGEYAKPNFGKGGLYEEILELEPASDSQ